MDEKELLETYFTECEFNDECDECGNPNQEQSWAVMTGFEGEVDCYLCQSCAIQRATEREKQNQCI